MNITGCGFDLKGKRPVNLRTRGRIAWSRVEWDEMTSSCAPCLAVAAGKERAIKEKEGREGSG